MPQIVVLLVIQATYAVLFHHHQLVHYSIRVAHCHHDPTSWVWPQ